MKLEKPWLQALEEREAKKYHPAGMPEELTADTPDPQPKRMKDSYHSLVRWVSFPTAPRGKFNSKC